jgi:phosphate transport system protein
MAQKIERIFGKPKVKTDVVNLVSQLAMMGGQVEAMLGAMLDALQTRDVTKAARLGGRKTELAVMRQNIDNDTEELLIKYKLGTQDLRRVVAVIKIAADIERIGQLSANIAWRLKDPENMTVLPSNTGIMRLGKQVQRQVVLALDTLAHESPSRAMQVYHSDDDIDRLHEILQNDILELMTQSRLNVSVGTHLMFIIRHYERMADHASNIAEAVYYAHTANHLQQDIQNTTPLSAVPRDEGPTF